MVYNDFNPFIILGTGCSGISPAMIHPVGVSNKTQVKYLSKLFICTCVCILGQRSRAHGVAE